MIPRAGEVWLRIRLNCVELLPRSSRESSRWSRLKWDVSVRSEKSALKNCNCSYDTQYLAVSKYTDSATFAESKVLLAQRRISPLNRWTQLAAVLAPALQPEQNESISCSSPSPFSWGLILGSRMFENK